MNKTDKPSNFDTDFLSKNNSNRITENYPSSRLSPNQYNNLPQSSRAYLPSDISPPPFQQIREQQKQFYKTNNPPFQSSLNQNVNRFSSMNPVDESLNFFHQQPQQTHFFPHPRELSKQSRQIPTNTMSSSNSSGFHVIIPHNQQTQSQQHIIIHHSPNHHAIRSPRSPVFLDTGNFAVNRNRTSYSNSSAGKY
jgi:hypothetical protein